MKHPPALLLLLLLAVAAATLSVGPADVKQNELVASPPTVDSQIATAAIPFSDGDAVQTFIETLRAYPV